MEKKKAKKKIKIEFPNFTKNELEFAIKGHLLKYTLQLIEVSSKGLLPIKEPRYLLAFINNWVEDNIRIGEEDLNQ